METTNYQLYGGRIGLLTEPGNETVHASAYACLHTFLWQIGARIQYRIAAWHNTAKFDALKDEIQSLAEPNVIDSAYSDYLLANAAPLGNVKTIVYQICSISEEDFYLQSVFVCTRLKQMVFVFQHQTEETKITVEYFGAKYDAVMNANLALGYSIVTLAWAYSDTNSGTFAEMSPVPLPQIN